MYGTDCTIKFSPANGTASFAVPDYKGQSKTILSRLQFVGGLTGNVLQLTQAGQKVQPSLHWSSVGSSSGCSGAIIFNVIKVANASNILVHAACANSNEFGTCQAYNTDMTADLTSWFATQPPGDYFLGLTSAPEYTCASSLYAIIGLGSKLATERYGPGYFPGPYWGHATWMVTKQ
jgi:hypothetical protein